MALRHSCLGDGGRSNSVAGCDRSRGTGDAEFVATNGQQGGRPMTLLLAQIQAIPQGEDYIRILPELILSVFGILVMILDPLVDEEKSQKTLGLIGFVGTLAGLASTWYMSRYPG